MGDEGTIYPLIINGSGLQTNSFNNTYRYSFPQGAVTFKNSKVAVATVNMYYSWFNITEANGNNTFSIIWPVGAGTVTYNITIPDGYYNVSGLNTYIQQFCIVNGLYLINGSGDYVYYLELIENANYYSVQLNTYSVPTSLPLGFSAPGSWPGYPTTAFTPQLIVPNTNFRLLIGFNPGTYPSPQQITTYSKLSDFTPQVTPIQSLILACTLLNNRYSNPSTILYSFSTGGVSFGSLIESSPSEFSFVNIQDGQYPYFDIQFLDQNFNQVNIKDTNIIVQLLIKNK